MFKKQTQSSSKPKSSNGLTQLGIFEVPQDDDNDSDLEAELLALTSGTTSPKMASKPKPKLIPDFELNQMVAQSLRDTYSDDEDMSSGEDDPDLLSELQEITGDEPAAVSAEIGVRKTPSPENTINMTEIIQAIEKRIIMYEIAEKNAKTSGEVSRARRFNRGFKTLQELLKQAKAGKPINIEDIPPEVSTKKATAPVEPPAVPNRPAPPPPEEMIVESAAANDVIILPTSEQSLTPTNENEIKPTNEDSKAESETLKLLKERLLEYKKAALQSKKEGDKESALQFIKVVKQFEVVIKMAENGEAVDLSDMPPPPDQLMEFLKAMNLSAPGVEEPAPASEVMDLQPATNSTQTLLEALNERLATYKKVEEKAKEEGNSGKVRRFGRIIKQYEDSIKAHKAGKPIVEEELPVPPGFGPLPKADSSPQTPPTLSTTVPNTPSSNSAHNESSTGSDDGTAPKPKSNVKKELTSRVSGSTTNLAEKQMQILLSRQKEFKIAAIEAKKAGEIEQAKEYLLIFKKFEKLLDAAAIGLPVDLNSLPIPPSQRSNLEESFAIINEDDCDPNDNTADIRVRLEEQLAKQLMMCRNTRDHHKAMGDIAGMNRFENLALSVQKDLDFLRASKTMNLAIPKFHYEQKSFNIIHCNTDLSDNELEICIVRGINYNVSNPKDVDTYVKIEFPYPQEDPFKTKTTVIKNTDNPDYDQKFKVEIQRSNRQCQRVFKRHAIRIDIYSRGCCLGGICWKFPMCCFSGFLRSDVLIGTVSVKLQQLEAKCDIHESFDILDGRKVTGGKLEVKVRCRNPILTKQIEHIDEKWLVLDD